MGPSDAQDNENGTEDDIRDAIESLNENDTLRMLMAGRSFLAGTEYQDAEELVNEAVLRAMEGAGGDAGRHWPKRHVPFVAFMIMTMLSIANGSRESHAMSMTDRLEGLALEGEGADHVLDCLGFLTQSVETHAVGIEEDSEAFARVKADAEQIEALFANDQDVAWLVMCIKEGQSPAKARALAGFTLIQYETIRKRMRRGVAKLFPGRRTL